MSIPNYYAVFKMDIQMTPEQIQEILLKHERVWLRRESDFPEKAHKVLSVIADAKACFKDAFTKQEYDKKLQQQNEPEKKEEIDPRSEQFAQWYQKCKQFYDSAQYDLAQIAAEKAASFLDKDDAGFYSLAAKICIQNKNVSAALDYCNKAIISDKSNISYFITKAEILGMKAASGTSDKDYDMFVRFCRQCITQAKGSNDTRTQADVTAIMAYYMCRVGIESEQIVLDLARDALSLGDTTGYALKVLDQIDQIHAKIDEDYYDARSLKDAFFDGLPRDESGSVSDPDKARQYVKKQVDLLKQAAGEYEVLHKKYTDDWEAIFFPGLLTAFTYDSGHIPESANLLRKAVYDAFTALRSGSFSQEKISLIIDEMLFEIYIFETVFLQLGILEFLIAFDDARQNRLMEALRRNSLITDKEIHSYHEETDRLEEEFESKCKAASVLLWSLVAEQTSCYEAELADLERMQLVREFVIEKIRPINSNAKSEQGVIQLLSADTLERLKALEIALTEKVSAVNPEFSTELIDKRIHEDNADINQDELIQKHSKVIIKAAIPAAIVLAVLSMFGFLPILNILLSMIASLEVGRTTCCLGYTKRRQGRCVLPCYFFTLIAIVVGFIRASNQPLIIILLLGIIEFAFMICFIVFCKKGYSVSKKMYSSKLFKQKIIPMFKS